MSLCQCGNVKSERAKLCRSCYDMLRTIKADENAEKKRSYCECGREKTLGANMCSTCRNELNRVRFGTKADEHDTCPECGGRKLIRSERCWDCHVKTQSERWSRIWAERKKEQGWKSKYVVPMIAARERTRFIRTPSKKQWEELQARKQRALEQRRNSKASSSTSPTSTPEETA